MFIRYLAVVACLAFTTACQTTTTPSSPTSNASAVKSQPKMSLKKAFKTVFKSQGVITTTTIGQPKSVSTRGQNSRFIFDFRETNQYATLPTTVTVQLSPGAAADSIKASGANVYAFIRPQIKAEKVGLFLNSERNPKYTYQTIDGLLFRERPETIVNRVQLPNTNRCDGYYVILGPQNDYKLQWSFDDEYRIRAFGSRGTDRFYVKSIEDQVTTRATGNEASFSLRPRNSRYQTCFADAATRGRW